MPYHAFIAFMLAALIAFSAWAHEGSTHVMGTVTQSSAEQLVVKATDGKTVSIALTPETRFRAAGSPTSTAVPKVGDRVVVELTGDAKNPVASEVRFSSAPGKRAR